MFNRADYMDKRCTHEEYYGQFITPTITRLVLTCIGRERIKKSTDPHMNDIPLRIWDSLTGYRCSIFAPMSFPPVRTYDVGKKLAEANGGGGVSHSDMVCILKVAAQAIKAGK